MALAPLIAVGGGTRPMEAWFLIGRSDLRCHRCRVDKGDKRMKRLMIGALLAATLTVPVVAGADGLWVQWSVHYRRESGDLYRQSATPKYRDVFPTKAACESDSASVVADVVSSAEARLMHLVVVPGNPFRYTYGLDGDETALLTEWKCLPVGVKP
jgi:hypothetical protein